MSQIFVSKNNSSYAPIAANASFVGQADSLSSWQEIDINLAGDPTVAPGVLYFEFSPDAALWDVSIPLTVAGPMLAPIILRVVLPYFRVRYENGLTALTSFRLTTVYHRNSAIRLTRFLNQSLDDNEPVEVVRAVIAGEQVDGTYANVPIRSGGLQIMPVSSSVSTSGMIAQSTLSVTLLDSNPNRIGATVVNDSTADLLLKLGTSASTNNFTVRIKPGGYYEVPFRYAGYLSGIWVAGGSGAARVEELT